MKQPGKGGRRFYGQISNAAVYGSHSGGTGRSAGSAVFAVLGLVCAHRSRSSHRWPSAA